MQIKDTRGKAKKQARTIIKALKEATEIHAGKKKGVSFNKVLKTL